MSTEQPEFAAAEPVVPFRVLFVCTANLCRSPLAENLFRHALATKGLVGGWDIRSAGTNAAVGTRTHPLVLKVLSEKGINMGPVQARPVTPANVEGADLILCMTRRHRAEIVDLVPAAVRRTFTLRQFARWCDAARRHGDVEPVRHGPDLLALAIAGQSRVQPGHEHDDNIEDPIGLGLGAFRACRTTTAGAIEEMLRRPE